MKTMNHVNAVSDLAAPVVGQRIRTLRPLVADNGMGGCEIPAGVVGKVVQVDLESAVPVLIELDHVQTINLASYLSTFEKMVGNRLYGFVNDPITPINGMYVGGLLEFHLTCDYVD